MHVLFLKAGGKKEVAVRSYVRRGAPVRGYHREVDSGKEKPQTPAPRSCRLPLLSPDMKQEQYLAHVMQAFRAGWKDTAELPELAGYRRFVSAQMFTTSGSGLSKITKNNRHVYLNYIIDAVKNPQEMWVDAHDPRDKTLYCLAQYQMKPRTLRIVATFKEASVDVWLGWSAYQDDRAIDSEYEKKRTGKRVYASP